MQMSAARNPKEDGIDFPRLFPTHSFPTIAAVPKPVLGRNLGALLGKGSRPAAPPEADAPKGTLSGPGMGSLIRGTRTENAAAPTPASVSPKRAAPLIPRWFLFAADALLLGSVLVVVCRRTGPLTSAEAAFCGIAVGVGCILGIAAICMDQSPPAP